jgi:predicted nucleic acid-binding protein
MSFTNADVRIALDTNVLAYAEGVNGADRQAAALAIVRDLSGDDVILPVQALGELFVVLVRRARRPADTARAAVLAWADAFPVVATARKTIVDAMEVAASHRLGFWDSVMLAVAAQAECRVLLSEDLQDGFTWRGVTVRNPFAAPGLPRA